MNIPASPRVTFGTLTPHTPLSRLLSPTVMYSDGGPGIPAGGAGSGAGAGTGGAAAGTGAGAGGTGAGAGAGGDDLGLDKDTYPKEVVEAIVRDRLARATKDQPSADELKKLRENAAKATELERSKLEEVDRLKLEKKDLEDEVAQLKGAVAQTSARDQLKALVADPKIGATNADAVATLLLNNPAVTIDDAGQVQGAETAVAILKAQVPELFTAGNGGSGGSGGSGARDLGQGNRGESGSEKKGGVEAGAELFASRRGRK